MPRVYQGFKVHHRLYRVPARAGKHDTEKYHGSETNKQEKNADERANLSASGAALEDLLDLTQDRRLTWILLHQLPESRFGEVGPDAGVVCIGP